MKNAQCMFVVEDKDKISLDLETLVSDNTVPLVFGKGGDSVWLWISREKLRDLASTIELALQAEDDAEREARGRLRDGDKDAVLGEVPF